MRALKITVRTFCFLPFVTGLGDVLLNARIFGATGVALPDEATSNPALNSQIGFLGAYWFGFGLLLWKCAADLDKNADWFRLLLGILFLSGTGRAIAAAKVGLPPAPLTAGMAVELIGAPLAFAWHRSLVSLARREN